MSISDFDRAHIADILAGHGDWFTAQLLRLCAKADTQNLAKIEAAFPDVVGAYLDWRDKPVRYEVSDREALAIADQHDIQTRMK